MVTSLKKDVVSLTEVLRLVADVEDIAVLENLPLAGARVARLRRAAELVQEQLVAAGCGSSPALAQLAHEYAPAQPAGPKLSVVGGTDSALSRDGAAL
ncbi:hypothetical protein [Tahibacter harae]|uniref:Uncharacterized protein n=1 Tax=Tahibacter harae TaxID=2963937 RepID=A0ABT1QQA5_9GAMM|nr:hypothetical protein [Tahibacter harae]MCQ4164457.1 hypothetical protein [Tahibacter harae]